MNTKMLCVASMKNVLMLHDAERDLNSISEAGYVASPSVRPVRLLLQAM